MSFCSGIWRRCRYFISGHQNIRTQSQACSASTEREVHENIGYSKKVKVQQSPEEEKLESWKYPGLIPAFMETYIWHIRYSFVTSWDFSILSPWAGCRGTIINVGGAKYILGYILLLYFNQVYFLVKHIIIQGGGATFFSGWKTIFLMAIKVQGVFFFTGTPLKS